MIPTLFPLLASAQTPMTDMDWMPWMLGIFGTIIAALFVILISMSRQGFAKLERKVDHIDGKVNEHETRLQLVEAKTDSEDIARHILTMLRAGGSGGFDINDFKKR